MHVHVGLVLGASSSTTALSGEQTTSVAATMKRARSAMKHRPAFPTTASTGAIVTTAKSSASLVAAGTVQKISAAICLPNTHS